MSMFGILLVANYGIGRLLLGCQSRRFLQLLANIVQSDVLEAELIEELVLIKTPRRVHTCSKSEKCCK